MVFGFWKKRAVKFIKDEEVEISFDPKDGNLPEIFITKVVSQSSKKIFFQLPKLRKIAIQPGKCITVHFRRENQIGSFKSTIREVMEEEFPPTFSISAPSHIFWEDIVPSRLALREFLHMGDRKTFLRVSHKENELDAVLVQIEEDELLFSGQLEFDLGNSLQISICLVDQNISFNASVLSCSPEGEGFVTRVSLSELPEDDLQRIREYFENKS